MSNPKHCVVCKCQLTYTTRALGVDNFHDDEEDGVDVDASFATTQQVVQIHCPQCELLYRVVDPGTGGT